MNATIRRATLPIFEILVIAAAASFFSAPAIATTLYSQGFETNTSGWSDGTSYGAIERRDYATNAIPDFEGDYYANVSETMYGPYTFFGGADTGPVGFTASVATYFDIGDWQAGSGFDYSVAAENQSGAHLRDFIFHIFVNSDGNVVVGDSNNSLCPGTPPDCTDFAPTDRSDKNHTTVTDAGWYVLQHEFFNNGGALGVEFNLLDADGTLLYSDTRSNPSDNFSSVYGGNYYGWFTDVTLSDGLNIDSVSLRVTSVPGPGVLGLFALGLAGLLLTVHKRSRLPEASI